MYSGQNLKLLAEISTRDVSQRSAGLDDRGADEKQIGSARKSSFRINREKERKQATSPPLSDGLKRNRGGTMADGGNRRDER
jgi:hypothetical protein